MRGLLLYFPSTRFRAGPRVVHSPLDVAQNLTNGSADHVPKHGSDRMLPTTLAPTSATDAGYKHVRTTNLLVPESTSTLTALSAGGIRAGPVDR